MAESQSRHSRRSNIFFMNTKKLKQRKDSATLNFFILEPYRQQGLGKRMVGFILSDPLFNDIRFWWLDTRDAHSLYRKFGFTEPAFPEKIMEKFNI